MPAEGEILFSVGNGSATLTIQREVSAQLNAHATLAKALNKAGHDDVVLWWKRTERKPGAQRRTQVGKPIVVMSEDLFLDVLRELRDRGER